MIDELTRLRERESSSMAAFQRWIAYARHWLMYTAAFGFVPYGAGQTDSYSAIMEGRSGGRSWRAPSTAAPSVF
ncbi:hypothetical protein M5E87_05180 [Flavonifractor plautii]|nr:hypothetical protein M5E87_05180 [Flavonifractor plautii]